MEIRTGVDIIEVNRIKESIEQIGQVFVDRIFTEKEQEYCEKSNKMLILHFIRFFAIFTLCGKICCKRSYI